MSADNTQLNPVTASGGDWVRDLARQTGNIKTQAFQLDLGGPSSNAEVLIVAGQQVAAASVPVVIASDQTALPTLNALGAANWGQSVSVAPGATDTPVSLLSTAAGYQIKGLVAHGTGDGYFFIQVNGATRLSGRTRMTAPMLQMSLQNGIGVAAGSTVSLRVTNESPATADYEVTLLGA